MAKFILKKNDTLPVFEKTLKGADGQLFKNLDEIASVNLIMADYNGTEKVNAAAVLDTATGKVSYQWLAADTDTKGEYKVEFQVTYDDGNIRTCPQNTYWYVDIIDDLGD